MGVLLMRKKGMAGGLAVKKVCLIREGEHLEQEEDQCGWSQRFRGKGVQDQGGWTGSEQCRIRWSAGVMGAFF